MNDLKKEVHDFWNASACGENIYLKGENEKEKFNNQLKIRYQLEPYILSFAKFGSSSGKKVLEIGVGLGADHQKFAENGAILFGCDLTKKAVDYTKQRLSLFGLNSSLQIADAENLPYENNFFDFIYSWGVIHHSPDTKKAAEEIFRILKPDGEARIMIYHKKSFVGYMLWFRYAFLKFKPFTSLNKIFSNYLESPGTKAYSVNEAKELFNKFTSVNITTVLTHGDLLCSEAGQRHKGILLDIARIIFPRFIIKTFFPKNGLFMLIELIK